MSTQTKKPSRKRVLTLEVEGGGRTFDFNHEELKMVPEEEPEIRLHFLRFGLLSEEDKIGLIRVKAEENTSEDQQPIRANTEGNKDESNEEEGTPVALDETFILSPKLENFELTRTGVKAGYLYVMDEADLETPVEYEINEGGTFNSISWEKRTDLREKDGKISTDAYHDAEYKAVLWVAYSPVQWSIEFYDRLKDNTEDRKIYMNKVTCNGFNECDELPVDVDYLPVKNITAYFPKLDESVATNLQSKLDALQGKEIAQKEKQKEKRPEKEYIHPNMFITLEDPLNSLFTISAALSKKTLEFRALIDAIQSGETLNAALQRLESGNDNPPEADETGNYAAMFSLALTSYFMVYSDKDSKKKYDGGVKGWHEGKKERGAKQKSQRGRQRHSFPVDHDYKGFTGGLDLAKVEAILGFEDRQKFRKTLQTYRTDYANFARNKQCKRHYEYYLHNHPERRLQGCHTILETLIAFYPNPYNWDKHLLLKKDYKKEDDLQNWVYQLLDDEQQYTATAINEKSINSKAPDFTGKDTLHALLIAPIDLTQPIEDDPLKYNLALAGIAKAMLQVSSDEAFSMRTVKGKTYKTIAAKHEFVKKKINKKFKLGKDLIKRKGNQLYLNPEVFGKNATIDWEEVKKSQYTGKKKKILKILKRNDGLVYIGKKNGKHKFEIPYEKSGEKLSKSQASKNALNQKVTVVLNSRTFNGTVAFLQLLNMKGAIEDFSKNTNLKTSINLTGVSAELTEAALMLQKIRVERIGLKVSRGLSGTIKIVGAIGGIVSAGICFYDSIKKFNKRDNDAGLALVGAGIAFGVAVFAGGPAVWIALGIGMGLVLLAEWLTDTPLEYFFKNFLLSDAERLPRGAKETPMEFNKRLLQKRYDMVKDKEDQQTIMRPKDAAATLFDIIVCKTITFEPIEPNIIENKPGWTGTPGGGISTYKVTIFKFQVTVNFFQLFNDKEQFFHRVFLFQFGVKKGNPIEITNTRKKKNIRTGNLNTGVSVVFEIPEAHRLHINRDTEIIYAVQLKLNNGTNQKFPYPRGWETNRYMGTKIKPTSTEIMFIDATQEENTKNLPLKKLLSYQTWK